MHRALRWCQALTLCNSPTSTPSSVVTNTNQKVTLDVEMDKENTVDLHQDALVVAAVTESDSRAIDSRSVFDPRFEGPSPKKNAANGQSDFGQTTIFTDFNEAEDSDEENYPSVRKRKRKSVSYRYLAGELAHESDPDVPPKKKQGPTWKGHEIKHGIPIGVWSLSDEAIVERKHVVYGFLDPKGALHGRKYPERKDGTKFVGNFPSGTGSWAAKFDTWLLDPHLHELSRKELTEYVRIRVNTWRPDELPEERDALDKHAVDDAKIVAAATDQMEKTDDKEPSARKAKKAGKFNTFNEAKSKSNTPQRPFGEPSPNDSIHSGLPLIKTLSFKTALGPELTPSKESSNGAVKDNNFVLSQNDFNEPSSRTPAPKFTPNPRMNSRDTSSPVTTPSQSSSKVVVKGRDVLLGYWKDSSEPQILNKHAIYGVVQANNVFRIKVVPETRDARPVKGNYPTSHGGCWVNYDTCVLQPYLKDLMRMEIEEYSRFCLADPDYTEGNQGPAIERAKAAARKKVAEDAGAMGLNVVEYNRKKRDIRDQAAVSRENERLRKKGEIVETPVRIKTEMKPTAIRSDKATSDAIAQKLKRERKEAKRATMNSRADSELAEAIRQSAQEHEAKESPGGSLRKTNALSVAEVGVSNHTDAETTESGISKDPQSATEALEKDTDAPPSDVSTTNGLGSDKSNSQTPFHQLDRKTQREKMEWRCKNTPTSAYHRLDRAGQLKHVDKHIDQLIERQLGGRKSHRHSHLVAQSPIGPDPSAVAAAPPPPTESTSTSETTATPLRDAVANIPDTRATTAAPEVTAVSHPGAPADTPSAPAVQQIRTNSHSEPLVNTSTAHISPEVATISHLNLVPHISDTQLSHFAPSAPTFTESPRISGPEPKLDGPTMDTAMMDTVMMDAPMVPDVRPITHGSGPQPVSAILKTHAITRPIIQPRRKSQADYQQEGRPQQEIKAAHMAQRFGYTSDASPASISSSVPGPPSTPPIPAPTKQYVTPYPHQSPAPQQAAEPNSYLHRASPAQQTPDVKPGPSPQPTPASEAKEDDDGIKYRARPTGQFGGLHVGVKRAVVSVEDTEYIKHLVLMPLLNSQPVVQQAAEVKVDEDGVKYKLRMNGIFEGHLVGIKREVITLAGDEDYMKFVVLVAV